MALRVAWIGNSYTFYFDMPGMVTALAAGASPPTVIEHKQTLHGGWTLGQHYRRAPDSAMEPSGIGRVEGGARDLLSGHGPFDLVVLQDQSQTPGYDTSSVSDADLAAVLAALSEAAAKHEHVKVDDFLKEGVDSGARGRGDSGPLNRAETLLRLRDFYGPAIAACGARPVLYSSWGRPRPGQRQRAGLRYVRGDAGRADRRHARVRSRPGRARRATAAHRTGRQGVFAHPRCGLRRSGAL